MTIADDSAKPAAAPRHWSWLLRIALISAPLSLIFLNAERLTVEDWRAGRGQIFGDDFINTWSGARLLLQGRIAEIFDPAAYQRALHAMWGPHLTVSAFPYPPNQFPLSAWTGLLPYGPALGLWSVVGSILVLLAAWPLSRRPLAAAAILLSPAVVFCLFIGQNGLVTAALIIAGLRLADRRPWLAGVLLGLATFKPQLGLLIPIALVAAGRWRVIAAAAASAAGLAAAATLMTGAQGWTLYLTRVAPYQQGLLEHSGGTWRTMTPSPLGLALYSGAPLALAWLLQGALSLACAVGVFLRFRSLRREGRAIGGVDILLLVAASFLATPYSFVYDMPSLALALLLASAERPDFDARATWRWGAFTLWIAPIATVIAGLCAIKLHVNWFGAGAALAGLGCALVWLAARGAPATSLAGET